MTVIKIKELEPETHGHNIIVKVLNTDVKVDRVKPDGKRVRVWECLVGDETGCILFTARNGILSFPTERSVDLDFGTDQCDLMVPGSTLCIRNARIDMFQLRYMRLVVDMWGLVKPHEDAAFTVKKEFNLSDIAFQQVQVPLL